MSKKTVAYPVVDVGLEQGAQEDCSSVAYPVVDVGLEQGVQEDCDERDEKEDLNHLDPSGPW